MSLQTLRTRIGERHDRKWDHPQEGSGAEVNRKWSVHKIWIQIHLAWLVEYFNYLLKNNVSTLGRAVLHTPQLGQIQTFMLLASPQNSVWKARETNWTDCWAFCFCGSVETHNAIFKVFEIANIVLSGILEPQGNLAQDGHENWTHLLSLVIGWPFYFSG